MTQGQYFVGLDINRDRYFPRGVVEGDALNLVDNPQALRITRIGATNDPPTYTRTPYEVDYTDYWSFTTGTAVNAGMYIGNTNDHENAFWVTNGQQITIRLDFLGVLNYTGEQLRFTVGARGGTTSVNTTVNLTNAWQSATVTFTPDSEHLTITIERITTLTNVIFNLRKLFIVNGATAPTAFNAGDASDYYEDISTYVRSASWNNGMDDYDQTVSGGSKASVIVDNLEGHFFQNDDNAANVIVDGDFAVWSSATEPQTWSVLSIVDANNITSEVGSDKLFGQGGTGALNIYATTRVLVGIFQPLPTAFQRYRVRFSIGASSGTGGVRFGLRTTDGNITWVSRIYTLPGVYTFYFTAGTSASGIDFSITNNRYPCDVTLEFVEVYAVPRYAGMNKETIISIRGDDGSSENQLWIGRVIGIRPTGGYYGDHTVTLDCVDAMAEFNQLDYRPTTITSTSDVRAAATNVFDLVEGKWPYAKDYWILGVAFLGLDTWLFEGPDPVFYGGAGMAIDYPEASASNNEKGIAAQAYMRDLMALEIGGRFYLNTRTGQHAIVMHDYDPSIVATTALTDDDFDDYELPYAEDVLNTVTIWYKQKREGTSNIVLWSSQADIVVPGKSSKTITGRYFDPTNETLDVSALSTLAIVRNTDYVISPNPNNQKVSVSVDAGSNSVTFTITNDREIDVTFTTLQIRGMPFYSLTEQSISVQNSESLIDNNIQKQDYNLPLINSSDTAIAIATGLTTMRGKAIERLQSITFSATKTDARYSRALAATFGVHYTITSTVLKHTAEYVLIGERHQLTPGGEHTHMVTWIFAPMDLMNYWYLGQAGRSELGETTIPIY